MFTYTLICRVLTKVLDAGVLPERQAHEILGRLGLILRKFAYDLRLLSLPNVYTLAGHRCHEAFDLEYQYFRARYGAMVDGFAYDNQPYAFDYACFVERNGGAVAGPAQGRVMSKFPVLPADGSDGLRSGLPAHGQQLLRPDVRCRVHAGQVQHYA